MSERDRIIEDAAADRPTAREANADDAPVKASDPRSVTIDRGSVEPASPGASDDEAAARDHARD